MKLICTGKPSKISRSEARAAVLFYCELLIPKYRRKSIKLRVNFIRGFRKRWYAQGGMRWLDRGYHSRNMVIDVDADLPRTNTLLTLAHEVVHVKQYATGELRDYRKRYHRTRWQGKVVDEHEVYYYDLPWEIEAHGREGGMYIRWQEQL